MRSTAFFIAVIASFAMNIFALRATGHSTIGLELLCVLPLFLVFAFNRRRHYARNEANAKATIPFSLLVENSGDLIAISDESGVIRFINRAGRQMVGITDDQDITKLNRLHFYPEDLLGKLNDEVIPTMRANGNWVGELAYRHHKTGERIPVQANFVRLTDPVTNEYLGIAVVGRDIRDRVKLERTIDRFFDVSLDMLAIANTKGEFLKMNPAFSEILGWTRQELMAGNAIDFIHPADIAATQKQLEEQRDGRPVLSFENRYRTKLGDYRWFSWKSYPDGELTYGAARDVTDEKLRQAEIEELSKKAVESSRAKSEFLANMSHEIRTPINGVMGMTALLLDTKLSDQQLDFAQQIKSSSESLLTIINDILDFSKIEAGKLQIENVDFNLENLIEETSRSISWIVRNKSLPLIIDTDKDFASLFRGDPGRIRQILNNLLSNAVKFTSQGAIKLEVKVAERHHSATTFRFAVHDTGVGLTANECSTLFQPFTQADASTARVYGGTGLGLSISKQLVDLMGGEIGVTSEKHQGSTFWFTLTFEHSKSQAVAKKQTSAPPTKYPNAQILVAEDNFVNQKILLAMLEKMGFKAQTVANGNEVLQIMRERQFDLILMDCQMPELDGYEATKRLRKHGSRLPIIALTANALKGDRDKCIESGMDDYASKPVNQVDLALMIERWLETSMRLKKQA